MAPGIMIFNEQIHTYYERTEYMGGYPVDETVNTMKGSISFYFGARLGMMLKKWEE